MKFILLVQCRNHILGLWSKDVTRILPLADCGVTDTPPEEESSRASLIRDVYAFLDQSVSLFTIFRIAFAFCFLVLIVKSSP